MDGTPTAIKIGKLMIAIMRRHNATPVSSSFFIMQGNISVVINMESLKLDNLVYLI